MVSLSPEAALVDSLIATIHDFPQRGIDFRDLTPVFADGPALAALARAVVAPFAGRFEFLGGLEARGFLIAGAAAGIAKILFVIFLILAIIAFFRRAS